MPSRKVRTPIPADQYTALRKKAEKLGRAQAEMTPRMSRADIQALVYELSVHQVELELQNEEVRLAPLELSSVRDLYADLFEFAPIGYISMDQQGRILETNQAAADILGFSRGLAARPHFSAFVE